MTRPNGRIKKIKGFEGKVDYHPKQGYINWWEDEMNNIVPRTTLKKITKDEIEEELEEDEKE